MKMRQMYALGLAILVLQGCASSQHRVYYKWSSAAPDSLDRDPRLISWLTSDKIEGTSYSLPDTGHIFVLHVLALDELPLIRLDSVVAYVRDEWNRDLIAVWSTRDIALRQFGAFAYFGAWHFPRGEDELRRLHWRVYMTLQTPEGAWHEGYAIDYDGPVRTTEPPGR
jgi:hypothetical protein